MIVKRVIVFKKSQFNSDEASAIKSIFEGVYPDAQSEFNDLLVITFSDDKEFSNREIIESIITDLTINIQAFESRLLKDTKEYTEKIVPLVKDFEFSGYYIKESDLVSKTLFKNIDHSLFLNEKIDDDLIYTIKTYLKCNMNTSKAASKLFMHRNTLINKIDKFNEITGYDVRDFADASLIYNILK